MKKARSNSDPITSDFSPWSPLDPGKSPPARAALIIAAVIISAFAIFFGVVHRWR
ncbi:hypothetical protein P12x_002584 [Tundrisphaera lichenicola]|uniref:hypothetical protein n=1 Tax=Tundrisphaera lichenicola TaxID=2029860 RepID=UPI003EB8663B